MSLNVLFNDKGISRTIKNTEGTVIDGNGLIKDLLEQYGIEVKPSKTVVFGGSFIALCVALIIGSGLYSAFETTWLSIGVSVIFFLLAVITIASKKTILNITYLFKGDFANKSQEKLLEGFNALNTSHKIWQNITSEAVEDSKYAGGANASVTRSDISTKLSLPSYIRSDLQAPMIALNEGNLYFLPDRILLVDSGETQEFDYSDLSLSISACSFQESDSLPRDANVIGKTWRVINKTGGPDKRIKDNPEIPICKYDRLHIYLGNYSFEIMISKPNVSNQFEEALMSYKYFMKGITLATAHNSSIATTSEHFSFSHEEIVQISLAGMLMMAIDGEIKESEIHHHIEFAKKHHENDRGFDTEAFVNLISNKFTQLHEEHDSIAEKVISIGKALSLSSEQKQGALNYLQNIIMADGVSTKEEQTLLTAFIKVM